MNLSLDEMCNLINRFCEFNDCGKKCAIKKFCDEANDGDFMEHPEVAEKCIEYLASSSDDYETEYENCCITDEEYERVDNVNHPKHYCRDGAMETIDEMELIFGIIPTIHFCELNAWKYRSRAMYKNGEEDIKKSDWYLKKVAELKVKLEDDNRVGIGHCI